MLLSECSQDPHPQRGGDIKVPDSQHLSLFLNDSALDCREFLCCICLLCREIQQSHSSDGTQVGDHLVVQVVVDAGHQVLQLCQTLQAGALHQRACHHSLSG